MLRSRSLHMISLSLSHVLCRSLLIFSLPLSPAATSRSLSLSCSLSCSLCDNKRAPHATHAHPFQEAAAPTVAAQRLLHLNPNYCAARMLVNEWLREALGVCKHPCKDNLVWHVCQLSDVVTANVAFEHVSGDSDAIN